MERKIGESELEVRSIGMGCWAIGGPFWDGDIPLGYSGAEDQKSLEAIRKARHMGIDFFDTADVYGTGHSEKILAEALSGEREKVVIATKFGNTFREGSREVTGESGEPEYIRQACEDSLRRLKTDYIDLYQFHINEYDPDKAYRVREVLEDLVQEGKIRYYGWSTDFVERAEIFSEGEHCIAIQHQENVLDDNPAMIDFCESKELASINRGPLAMGLLTGKYDKNSVISSDDVRGAKSPDWMQFFTNGRPSKEWTDKLDKIRQILKSDGRTLAQGALAWLWARSEQTIPIPGFKNPAQVEENCSALEYGPLNDKQMQKINKLLEREY